MTQITINIPDELLSRLNRQGYTVSEIIVQAIKNYIEQELSNLSPSDLEDYQNFSPQTINPITEQERAISEAAPPAIANTIIEQAWKNAENSQPSSSSEIWAEFEQVIHQIKNSDTKPS